MKEIRAWAAHGPKQSLVPFTYKPDLLEREEVEIEVEHCGICHSDRKRSTAPSKNISHTRVSLSFFGG